MSLNTKEYVAAYTQILVDIQSTQGDLNTAIQDQALATAAVGDATEKLAALRSMRVDLQRLLGPQDIGSANAQAVQLGVTVTP